MLENIFKPKQTKNITTGIAKTVVAENFEQKKMNSATDAETSYFFDHYDIELMKEIRLLRFKIIKNS